jgi:hypothetical protein
MVSGGHGRWFYKENDGAEAFATPDAIDRPSSTISSEARTMYEQLSSQGRKSFSSNHLYASSDVRTLGLYWQSEGD